MGGGFDRTTSSAREGAVFCGKFIIIIDGTLFKAGTYAGPPGTVERALSVRLIDNA